MVATKSAHLSRVAADRPILELGSRRTHIDAAVDAAVASYVGGVMGTSNVEAHHRDRVPVVGTMDHFAIQSWECPDQPIAETERAFFKAFMRAYPESASLLVDTYNMFGDTTGIRNAVRASKELQIPLKGIRLDSKLSVETVERARSLLNELACESSKIIVSGGVDEPLIRELKRAPVDIFGIGERLVTSADSPVGVGAVGKLSWVGGVTSMKRATGSGKATLPGPIQAYRGVEQDRLSLVPTVQSLDGWQFLWERTPHAANERPLCHCVWRHDAPLSTTDSQDWLERARNQRASAVVDFDQRGAKRSVILDDSVINEISRSVRER